MFPFTTWFIPLSLAIGLYGTRTAAIEMRYRGGRWRIDSILIVVLAWCPLAIWFLSLCWGPFE